MKMNKLDILISLYIFCILVAEVMGSKTIPLFQVGSLKLTASVAIFVLPIIFTINDVITEVYGKERARSVIRSGLLMIFLLLIFTVFATVLPPSERSAGMEAAYDQVFGTTARIAAASLVAFTVAEFTDVFIFVRLRNALGKKALWLRNNASNFISQFFDTTLFMFLAFYSLDKPVGTNLSFLVGLILPYWLLKCFMSVIETPFAYLGVRWLKDGELVEQQVLTST